MDASIPSMSERGEPCLTATRTPAMGDAKLDVIGAFDAPDAPFDGSNVAGVRCASTQVAPVDAAP